MKAKCLEKWNTFFQFFHDIRSLSQGKNKKMELAYVFMLGKALSHALYPTLNKRWVHSPKDSGLYGLVQTFKLKTSLCSKTSHVDRCMYFYVTCPSIRCTHNNITTYVTHTLGQVWAKILCPSPTSMPSLFRSPWAEPTNTCMGKARVSSSTSTKLTHEFWD